MMHDGSRSPYPDLHLTEIRALARRFRPDEPEARIGKQLQKGGNVCEPPGRTEEIIGVLAKAEFVKVLMAKGMTLPEAMRELGRRIWAMHSRAARNRAKVRHGIFHVSCRQ